MMIPRNLQLSTRDRKESPIRNGLVVEMYYFLFCFMQ